jgi:hypothetical protein
MATQPATVSVGDFLTAANWNNLVAWLGGSWSSYTPQLQAGTNPTLGSGSTVFGQYAQIGKLVVASVTINFGSSGTAAGSGNYFITVPVAAATPTTTITVGHGRIICAGTGHFAQQVLQNSGAFVMKYEGGGNSNVTASVPGAWTAGDSLYMLFSYQAA